MRDRFVFALPLLFVLALLPLAAMPLAAESADDDDVTTILPGDRRFETPDFKDYEAIYTSSSSKTGGFTLQARKTNGSKKLSLVDIIPMKEGVIVAQRGIDLKTHRAEFSAGPNFAWGNEFIVKQSSPEGYDWTRIPIGGGEPKRLSGKIEHGGYVSDSFSPSLAALMPMAVGTTFRMPAGYPRKDEFVSSELDEYRVLRKEQLELPSGVSCDCWVIEKKTWGSFYKAKELIWVAREAPFVFRRHRDVGGKQDFVSDVLAFRHLKQ